MNNLWATPSRPPVAPVRSIEPDNEAEPLRILSGAVGAPTLLPAAPPPSEPPRDPQTADPQSAPQEDDPYAELRVNVLADLRKAAHALQRAPQRSRGADYAGYVEHYAKQFGVSPALVFPLIVAESDNDPNAVSIKGATGLTQVMPKTGREIAAELGETYHPSKLKDPETSVRWGTYYFAKQLKEFKDPRLALVAYNAGPGGARTVQKNMQKTGRFEVPRNSRFHDGEGYTADYVDKIMRRAQASGVDLMAVSPAAPAPDPKQLDAAVSAWFKSNYTAPAPESVPGVSDVAMTPPPGRSRGVTGRFGEDGSVTIAGEGGPQTSEQDVAKALSRGLGVGEPYVPQELTAAQEKTVADYRRVRAEAQSIGTQPISERQAAEALAQGPVQDAPQDSGTVYATDIIRTSADPVVRAAFLGGFDADTREALLAQMPDDRREETERELARYKQESAGGALAFGALKGSPLWVLAPAESKAYAEAIMAEDPTAATIGVVGGGIASALLVGGQVRAAALKVPMMAKLAQAGRATKALTGVEKLGRWGFDATTRGATSVGLGLIRNKDALLSGDADQISTALREIAVSTAVVAIGSAPETLLPKGLLQPAVQAFTDLVVQSVGDMVLLDRNVLEPEYWQDPNNVQQFWTNIGMSLLMAANDVPQQAGGEAARPRVQRGLSVDEKAVSDMAARIASGELVSAGRPDTKPQFNIESVAERIAPDAPRPPAGKDAPLTKTERAALPPEDLPQPSAPRDVNRDVRRAEIAEGMKVDTNDQRFIDEVKEKFGDTRPTKAQVAEAFDVSRERAGWAIRQGYEPEALKELPVETPAQRKARGAKQPDAEPVPVDVEPVKVEPVKAEPADESAYLSRKDVDPLTLVFRESMQNRMDEVRESFPGDEYFPVVTINDGGKREILDGHNRTAVAKERGHRIPVVDVSRQEYDRLAAAGFDDTEIAYAALHRAKEHEAADGLNQQFRGANVHNRGMDAYDALEPVKAEPAKVEPAVVKTDAEVEAELDAPFVRPEPIKSYTPKPNDPVTAVMWDPKTGEVLKVFTDSDKVSLHQSGYNVLTGPEKTAAIRGDVGWAAKGPEGWRGEAGGEQWDKALAKVGGEEATAAARPAKEVEAGPRVAAEPVKAEPVNGGTPPLGAVIKSPEATALVASIRAGDAQSKNRGNVSRELPTGDLVHRRVPLSDIPDGVIEWLKESTDPSRVARYAKEKIDAPVYLAVTNRGTLTVSDGGHRVLAALQRGDKDIPALVPVKAETAKAEPVKADPATQIAKLREGIDLTKADSDKLIAERVANLKAEDVDAMVAGLEKGTVKVDVDTPVKILADAEQKVSAAPAEQKTGVFNKLVEDAEARQKTREKGARLRGGIPLDEMADLTVIGAGKVAKGAKTFAAFSKQMIADVGEWIKPHLRELWENTKSFVARTLGNEKGQLRVWHGSPYKFDTFEMRPKTGEGAMAFGHGLYFTSSKGVADYYAETLSKQGYTVGGKFTSHSDVYMKAYNASIKAGMHENAALQVARNLSDGISASGGSLKKYLRDYDVGRYREHYAPAIDALKIDGVEPAKGQTYRVTLHKGKKPGEYDYLKWESKPEYAQEKRIFDALSKEVGIKDAESVFAAAPKASEVYQRISDLLGSDEAASNFLLKAGIDGIDYPAGTLSGVKDSKTRNYVVFDPEAASIEPMDRVATMLGNETGSVRVPGGRKLTPKQQIHQATGFKKDADQHKDLKNIGAAFKKAERYSKEGFKAGLTQATTLMKAKHADAEGFKAAAVQVIKNAGLTPAEKGTLLIRYGDIETPGGLRRFEKAVDAVVERVEESAARAEIKDAFTDVSKKVKGLRPEYKRQVEAILDTYDVSRMTERTRRQLMERERLHKTATWAELPPRVQESVKRLQRKPIADLSIEEAREVTNTLQRLVAQNNLKQELIIEGRHRDHNKAVVKMKEEIASIDHKRDIRPYAGAEPQMDSGADRSLVRKAVDAIVGLDGEKPELIADKIGGEGGTFTKATYGALNDRERHYIGTMTGEEKSFLDAATSRIFEKEASAIREAHKGNPARVQAELDKLLGDKVREMSHTFGDKAGSAEAFKRVAQPVELTGERTILITPAQRMGVYNAVKSPDGLTDIINNDIAFDSNLDGSAGKMIGGKQRTLDQYRADMKKAGKKVNIDDIDKIVQRDKLNAEDVERIIASMSDNEKALADYMFESLNDMDGSRGRLSRTSVRLLGRDITLDNYWRRWKTNTYANYLDRGAKPTDFGSHVAKTLEDSGSLKARSTGARGTVVIEDAFTAYYESLALSAKYESYAETLRQAHQVMTDIKDVARAKGLVPEYRAIQDWLRDVEGGLASPRLAQAEKNVRGVIGRMTSGALSLNPFVPLKQLASYPFAISEIEAKYLAEGLKMMPGMKEAQRIRGLIAEYSPQTEMRLKRHAFNTEMADYASRHEVENFFGAKKTSLADLGTRGISQFDEAAILRIYKSAEAKIKGTTDLKGTEFNEATARLAEQVIRRTQPMTSTLERNAVQRAAQSSTWLKLGTMFTTPTNQIQNVWKRELVRFDRSDKTPEDYAHMIGVIGTVWIANAGLVAAIDSARDKAFGKEVSPYTVLMKMAKNTLAPYYFMQPVMAAIQDAGEYAVMRKRGRAYEFANRDLIDGILSQGLEGFYQIVQGVRDKPFETGDWENVVKGLTNALDVTAKLAVGVSPRSAIRYAYEMPKSVVDQILTPEAEKNVKRLAASAGYKPRPLSKTLTMNKKKYRLRMNDWKTLDRKVQAIVAQRLEYIDPDLWAAADKEKRKDHLRDVYREVKDGVLEANKYQLLKDGKLVAMD